ncbi:hypothetical protein CVT25_002115 [Psilocybe cyanescens]|uniref:Uncharacterized protein n=1 Tax=Psilocybe cyanescens TaxID=93625 RepID=A0A409XC49_PSICY|nr:hypothetical protein CVT25_002115 [Psilocybe cyanescens]
MKEYTSPVATPFVISNALNTPNRLGSTDYFTLSRTYYGGARLDVGTSESDSHDTEEVLLHKLHALEDAQARGSGSLIDSIPNELLALIFECGYFDFGEGQYPDTEFRSLMLQTSRRCRQLTLHTPSLWSVIYLSQSNVADELDHLAFYLERSAQYPLDIRLSCFWNDDLTDPVMRQLVPHSKRWRRLSIIAMNTHILSYLKNTPVPILDNLDISFFSHERRTSLLPSVFSGEVPRLTHLCVRNIDLDTLNLPLNGLKTLEIRGYGTWPTLARLTEMLSGSSTLERFILHVKPGQVTQQLSAEDDRSQTHIILPALRSFEVYSSEWLSPAIVSLIRVFVCPNLESLVLREGVGSASETARTILSYTRAAHMHKDVRLYHPSSMGESLFTGFPNRLYVQSASVALASRVMSAATLTSLELRKPYLPGFNATKAAFSSLKNLKHLFFLNVAPNGLMSQLLDTDGTDHLNPGQVDAIKESICIPSLETLVLEIDRAGNRALLSPYDYTAQFVNIFSLPFLRSLVLKNLDAYSWITIAKAFTERASQYTQLTSLKLINMTDILPVDHVVYNDIMRSFPHLRRLLLDSVGSNAFIHQLLPRVAPALTTESGEILPSPSPSLPWPDLEALSMCGDSNVSKPLLHRAIAAREEMGRPLKVLYLDDNFAKNEDSWNWLNERVQVRKAEPGFL